MYFRNILVIGKIGSNLKILNEIALNLCQKLQIHHVDSSQNHLFIESLKVALKKSGIENRKIAIILGTRYVFSTKIFFC